MPVVILGAGPAGMSCANALITFGLDPVVVERGPHPGGAQRANFHPNLWYLGAPGETGQGMTERLVAHFQTLPASLLLNARVRRVWARERRFSVELDGQEGPQTLDVRAVVLATGTQPRATPELHALAGRSARVIIGALSLSIRDHIRHARVLILGGGDNALDHALFLAERGNQVEVHTRREFSARAQFQAACANREGIRLHAFSAPASIEATEDGIRAGWRDDASARGFDWLLVMYGYQANVDVLECFAPDIRPGLTETGYIHVDNWQRTSVPGVYAAGDVTDCPQPSVPTAIAQGLTAARAIERDIHAVAIAPPP